MEGDANHCPRHIDVPNSFDRWIKAGTKKPRNIGPTAFAWITDFRGQTFLLSNGLRIRCDTKPEWTVGALVMLKSAVRLGANNKAIKTTRIAGRVDPVTFKGTLPRCKGTATGATDADNNFEVLVEFMNIKINVELQLEEQESQIENSILEFTLFFQDGVLIAKEAKITGRCSLDVEHSRKCR